MSESRNELDFDFIRLLARYIFQKLNLQHFLYFMVFVTFDVGDAVSASMMMESRGIGAEYNSLVKNIFINYGLSGVIFAKLLFIIIPLLFASILVEKSYWLINGVLVALTIAGLMAIQANMQKLSGIAHMSPMEINLIYMKILIILAIAGMILDNYFSDTQNHRAYTK